MILPRNPKENKAWVNFVFFLLTDRLEQQDTAPTSTS